MYTGRPGAKAIRETLCPAWFEDFRCPALVGQWKSGSFGYTQIPRSQTRKVLHLRIGGFSAIFFGLLTGKYKVKRCAHKIVYDVFFYFFIFN